MKTREIAKASKVPPDYLSKVLQNLGRHALVKSLRGVNGGVFLSKPASEITILEIVNAVDPIHRIRKCPLNLKAHGINLCPLHKKLDYALSLLETAFQTTTLAELLDHSGNNTSEVNLCERLSIN